MTSSVWLIIDGRRVERTIHKDPKGVEYIPASDYNELIDWISGHKACEWKRDNDGIWNTGCGEMFEFTHDGPGENKARFCQYCGNQISASKRTEATQ